MEAEAQVFYIGSWIPTLKGLENRKEGFFEKPYDIGDGLPQKIKVEVELNPAEGDVKYEGKGSVYSISTEGLLCNVDNMKVFENGLWIAEIRWRKELCREVRHSVYLKIFQALKDRLHKHKFHHDEQDSLIQVKESKESVNKDALADFIHSVYIQKFEAYTDQLSDFSENPKKLWLLFKKAMGELSFYRSFAYLTETPPYPVDSLMEAVKHNVYSPTEMWMMRLTVIGVLLGLSQFINLHTIWGLILKGMETVVKLAK